MSKAQQIYYETFSGAHVRSDEFKAGVLHVLLLKLDGVSLERPRFPVPSARLDAWMWGCEYGHDLVTREREREAAQA